MALKLALGALVSLASLNVFATDINAGTMTCSELQQHVAVRGPILVKLDPGPDRLVFADREDARETCARNEVVHPLRPVMTADGPCEIGYTCVFHPRRPGRPHGGMHH